MGQNREELGSRRHRFSPRLSEAKIPWDCLNLPNFAGPGDEAIQILRELSPRFQINSIKGEPGVKCFKSEPGGHLHPLVGPRLRDG